MPKITGGGKGHKKRGRKHQGGGGGFSNKTRFSEDPLEMYAVCTKQYGQGNVEVTCHDNVSRMCVIRKKFKGRGKRDNAVIAGTWLLVGMREFEVRAAGKKEKCDLLEVYRDNDKSVLQQHQSHINWSILKAQAPQGDEVGDDDDAFDFVDERTQKYTDLMSEIMPQCNKKIDTTDNNDQDDSSTSNSSATSSLGGAAFMDEEIDIDDI